ncbi:MAG: hypothetical protein KDA24_05045 [Deltaproteobacteria bacterium]|nr:hypothetical protein [Deltaproteobacteria bacterium]
MRTSLCLLLALLLPSAATAATTVVDTYKELAWLERQKTVDGTIVVKVPGLTSLALPKLQSVSERIEIAIPDLIFVDLPALREVGTDLNIGCALTPKNEWEDKGPLQPLGPMQSTGPSFADGPPTNTKSKSREAAAKGPGRLVLPQLRTVGGGLAICSPGVLGVEAPKLASIGTDLQFFAGRSWAAIDLPSLKTVNSTVFVWLDGAQLSVTAERLSSVGASMQSGGRGRLSLSLPALRTAAGFAITGTRQMMSGVQAARPSLELTGLEISSLERASSRLEFSSVGGLAELVLGELTRCDSVRIVDLPELTSLGLPVLPEVARSAVLGDLPALSSLDLSSLRRVGERLQLGGLGLSTLELHLEEAGSLVLAGQPSRVIRADKLVRLEAMMLEGLGLAELVSFASLESVAGPMQLKDSVGLVVGGDLPVVGADDATLRVFTAPKLTRVGDSPEHGLFMRRLPFTVVKLSALREVRGALSLTEMPGLTHLELPRLQRVDGPFTVGGSSRLVALQFPALEQAAVLELISLTALKRVVARGLDAQVRQSTGTIVASLEVGNR